MSDVVNQIGNLLQETQASVNNTANGVRSLQIGVDGLLDNLQKSRQIAEDTLDAICEQGRANRGFLSETTNNQALFLQECEQIETSRLSIDLEQQLNILFVPHALTEPDVQMPLPEKFLTSDDVNRQQQIWVEQNMDVADIVPDLGSKVYTKYWLEAADDALFFTDEYQKQIFSIEMEVETPESPGKRQTQSEEAIEGPTTYEDIR